MPVAKPTRTTRRKPPISIEQLREALAQMPEFARARRVGELFAAPALPIEDFCVAIDLPLSTFNMLRAQGRGPKLFRLGRRLYVAQAVGREWLAAMSETAEA